jgi:hypothetical protein
LGVFNIIYCQLFNYTNHLEQYWNYRYALLGDAIDPNYYRWEPGFVEVGSESGTSIPMFVRKRIIKADASFPYDWAYLNTYDGLFNPNYYGKDTGGSCSNLGIYPCEELPCDPIIPQVKSGINVWSDAPTDLGKYMQVLATEYELLRRENNPARYATLQEIKYTLDAVTRMDLFAEAYYYNDPSRASLNGYFYRDDVPANFSTTGCKFGCAPDFSSPGVGLPKPQPFDYNDFTLQSSTGSCSEGGDEEACDGGGHFQHGHFNEESHDQMIKLIQGLAFIVKYVHVDGVDDDARNHIHRMIKYLQGPLGLYMLYRPDGTQVCRGGQSIWYSTPLLGIQEKWGNGAEAIGIPVAASNSPVWNASQLFFFDPFARLGRIPVGTIYRRSSGGRSTVAPFSLELFSNLYILNDDYSKGIFPIPPRTRRPLLTGMSVGYTRDIPCVNKPVEYIYDITLELMASNLHDYKSFTPKIFVENMLNKISFKGYTSHMAYEWSEPLFGCEHESRFYYVPNQDCEPSDINSREHLERNGLQYMLMFNLYCLTYGKSIFDAASDKVYNAYMPIYDRVITHEFPYTSTNYIAPVEINNLNIEAANSLYIDCKIKSDGRINFTAPHTIIGPNFGTELGAVVNITNERMKCDANFVKEYRPLATHYRRANPNPTEEVEYMPNNETLDLSKLEHYIKVFPNPSNNEINIGIAVLKNENCSIEVFDMYGRSIKNIANQIILERGATDFKLYKKDFTSGNYLVKIIIGDNVETKKICFVD